MARLTAIGRELLSVNDELSPYLDEIMTLPKSIQSDMLNAMGNVVKDAVKETAHEMLTVDNGYGASGKYTNERTGIYSSVKVGRIKKNSKDAMYHTDVIFKGKQHGERLATIAFVNEYGALHKPNKMFGGTYIQPPRRFISKALLLCSDDAAKAAAEVFYKKFLKIK